MTGNAPVADSMPVTDNWPVCCGSFLPDKCCVQLRKQFHTHEKEQIDITLLLLYELSSDDFGLLAAVPSSRSFIDFTTQDKTVYTQQTVHYWVGSHIHLPTCVCLCFFLYCSLWFLCRKTKTAKVERAVSTYINSLSFSSLPVSLYVSLSLCLSRLISFTTWFLLLRTQTAWN